MNIENLFEAPQFSLSQSEKERFLKQGLLELDEWHREHCLPYAKIASTLGFVEGDKSSYPGFLPVSMFKEHILKSVPDDQVHKVLTSSGTSGQAVSRIYLDSATATMQGRALSTIMSHVLGPKRLPMLIIDYPGVIKNRAEFSARGAGILGMMTYGRSHVFALNDDLKPNISAIKQFLEQHKGTPKLLFGFTFLVWTSLMENEDIRSLDFSDCILVHSGGWKKLIEKAVSNEVFRQRMAEEIGIKDIYNFYGMVEQVGGVFLEGTDGYLYPPNFADVIIRDPHTFKELPVGEVGVIQVVSLLPKSYPGHSLLTEDLGVIRYIDKGVDGRMGKAFSVLGRIPQAELRGCSDVIAAG